MYTCLSLTFRALAFGALTFGALAFSTLAYAAVDQPLTSTERNAALSIAIGSMDLAMKRATTEHPLPRSMTSLSVNDAKNDKVDASADASANANAGIIGLDRHQVLLIQRKETKRRSQSTPARLAEVFLYDYAALTTDYRLVNLESMSIIKSDSLNQHHLPLNTNETTFAKNVLRNHPSLMATIKTEYEQLYNRPLRDLAQLSIKAVIHIPPTSSTRCHSERCAALSIVTDDLVSLTVEPIIVLREGKVLGLVND